MSLRTNQSGFSVIELAIAIVIVAIIGFAGYSVYHRQHNQSAVASQPATASDVPAAPAVSSTSDLDKAAAALDQTDPGGSNNTDAAQLDSQIANF